MGDRLPSLELLLGFAQSEREKLQTHFEALDQKAGLVLAGAGVFVTLSTDLVGAWAAVATGLAVLSAAFALAAFWPRDFPYLRAEELRSWLRAEEAVTRLMVLDTLAAEEPRTLSLLGTKAKRLKWAMGVLFVAAIAAGAGVATDVPGGSDERRPKADAAVERAPSSQSASAPSEP